MKIFIKHIGNTLNYGSMMMAENLITYISKKLKGDVEFFIDASTKNDLDRMKEATGITNMKIDQDILKQNAESKYLKKIRKLFLEGWQNKKFSVRYDLILVLGGDDLSEFYLNSRIRKLIEVKFLKNFKKLNFKKNLILVGQTIGPYTGIRKKVASKVFSDIKIYTRDDVNLKVMKDNYNIVANRSRDLALLDLNRQEEYYNKRKDILKKYNLEENEYITIVGTQLIKHYTTNQEDFIETFKDIMENIKTRYKNKKIVWLSHVTTRKPEESDNTLLDLINNSTDNYIMKNAIVIREELLPVEARIILGMGYFTITCRMHAAVSTFQMGKPAICLSYSPKYKGVIADGLNVPELVIEAKDDILWKGSIIREIDSKIELIEKEREKLIEKSQIEINKSQKILFETIAEIIQQ